MFSLDDYYANGIHRSLSGDYIAHGDLATADCVVALAFGVRHVNGAARASLSNIDLAAFISAQTPQLPIVTQTEVAVAIESPAPVTIVDDARNPNQRLDTTEFLEQVVDHMAQKQWGVALLVAHPNHMPWADYVCNQLGIATVVPPGLNHVRFDPDSDQYWTRSLSAWQDEVRARQLANDPRRVIQEP